MESGILGIGIQNPTLEITTHRISLPQASQNGVLVSSIGCAAGGLVGVLFHSDCPGGEVGETTAGDAAVGSFWDGLRTG